MNTIMTGMAAQLVRQVQVVWVEGYSSQLLETPIFAALSRALTRVLGTLELTYDSRTFQSSMRVLAEDVGEAKFISLMEQVAEEADRTHEMLRKNFAEEWSGRQTSRDYLKQVAGYKKQMFKAQRAQLSSAMKLQDQRSHQITSISSAIKGVDTKSLQAVGELQEIGEIIDLTAKCYKTTMQQQRQQASKQTIQGKSKEEVAKFLHWDKEIPNTLSDDEELRVIDLEGYEQARRYKVAEDEWKVLVKYWHQKENGHVANVRNQLEDAQWSWDMTPEQRQAAGGYIPQWTNDYSSGVNFVDEGSSALACAFGKLCCYMIGSSNPVIGQSIQNPRS